MARGDPRSWSGFERWLYGSAAEPSQGPGAELTPIQRGLDWLDNALLPQGDPPRAADFTRIFMAADALQQGWPFAEYKLGVGVQQAGSAADSIIVTYADTYSLLSAGFPPQDHLITMHAVLVTHTGGAGAGTVNLLISKGVPGVGSTGAAGAGIAAVSIAVGGSAALVTFTGGRHISAPKDYAFEFFVPATVGGETYTVQALVSKRPMGFPL